MAVYPYYPNQFQQYYPASYQPMQIPQQQMQPQQTVNQPANPVMNQNGIIWISGESEAAMYPIAPNNAVALWEKSGKTIYLKQADATGKPTMTVYDLVERETAETDGETKSNYVTKDDFSQVVGAMKDYTEILDALKNDVESIKGDVYGLAGKKKTAKKVSEVAEDE